MGRLEEIKRRVLENALKDNKREKFINETRIKYDNSIKERMNPKLEKQLRDRNHSLGKHPIFPNSEEIHFEEKIMGKRFNDVVKNYKKRFDTENIDSEKLMVDGMNLLSDTMNIENDYKEVLEKLAIDMVRNEYGIDKDEVEIVAELTPNINIDTLRKNPTPIDVEDMEFDNHESLENAESEVYKRRFINALIQGASKKGHHMFHLVDDDLTNLNPTLPNKYAKLMAIADLSYLLFDDSTPKKAGGVVKVDFSGEKPKIHAQAMVFPVLIHELIKGVMEILSAHGLPDDDKLSEYVMAKSDYTNAEPWDMRLGPALWERFIESIDPNDFDKKHYIYAELVSLPVKEFNYIMREIMLGSKEGKDKINHIIRKINKDLEMEEYEKAMEELNNSDDILGYDDLDNIDLDPLF